MTTEERVSALEVATETMKQTDALLAAQVGALAGRVTQHDATLDQHGKQLATLTAPNPAVVKVKGWGQWLWAHRPDWRTVAILLLGLVVLGDHAGGISCERWHWPWSKPNPPPPPPEPPPIPVAGLHVLVVYDESKMSTYDKGQLEAMRAQDVRKYLDAHCVKGADGKTPEWRQWDVKTDASQESDTWQKAFNRLKTKPLPALIISNGKDGYEGPEPKTVAEKMALLQKFGGP